MPKILDIEYIGCTAGAVGIGIDVASVQEVFQTTAITRVPDVPPVISGMANLRGTVVPVVDLFGVFDQYATLYKTVVLKTAHGMAALLISGIDDLLRFTGLLPAGEIPPALLNVSGSVAGKGIHEDRDYYILDVNKLVEFMMSAGREYLSASEKSAAIRQQNDIGEKHP
jgi:purine-binding chemotaxis protein CheW